jgi:hypothetical protein
LSIVKCICLRADPATISAGHASTSATSKSRWAFCVG